MHIGLSHIYNNQIFRFLVVGGINTVFGYGIFALLLWLGLHYSIASLLSTVLGILFNFKTTGLIVFKSHDNRLILKFFGVYGIVYLLNILGLYLFDLIGVNPYYSGAIMILPMAALAFVLNKKFVFSLFIGWRN